jgi:hypothetical protein
VLLLFLGLFLLSELFSLLGFSLSFLFVGNLLFLEFVELSLSSKLFFECRLSLLLLFNYWFLICIGLGLLLGHLHLLRSQFYLRRIFLGESCFLHHSLSDHKFRLLLDSNLLIEILFSLVLDLNERIVVLLEIFLSLIELLFVLSEGLLSIFNLLVHFILSFLKIWMLVVELISFFKSFSLCLLLTIGKSNQLIVIDMFASSVLVVGDDSQLVEIFLDSGFKLSLNLGNCLLAELLRVDSHII